MSATAPRGASLTGAPPAARRAGRRAAPRARAPPPPAAAPTNKELLAVAAAAAAAGAAVVADRVDKPRAISYKGAADLVTDTDTASEAAVLAVLRGAFPGHAILGEEGGVSGDVSSEYLWCVDPLDGTTNFAHGYPSFAVAVACLRRATPVAAAVVEFAGGPSTWVQRAYAAARNGGATLNGAPIGVSRAADLSRALLCTGFGYEHDACWLANLELFRELTDASQGVRRLGSAATDMCHVAAGITDGFWEFRLKPWDMAAGVLIAEEAGGTVTTLDGRAFSVFDRSVLVTNGALHGAMLARTEPRVAALQREGVDLSPWFIPEGHRVHAGRQLDD
jgi:myo-inositol-1(or 4)-monophosphatase